MSEPKPPGPPRCWRSYVCTACGCRYKCLIRPSSSEPGDEEPSENDPKEPLTEAAARSRPCPNCASAPGSSAKNPAADHGRLALLVTVCMFGAALGVLAFDSIGRYWSAVVFSAIALFSAVGHVLVIVLQRRRTRAGQAKRPAADDRIRIVETGPRWVRTGTAICLVAAFAVVPICLLPVLLVETREWPLLKGSDLEVVSPGDTVKLTLGGAGATVPFNTYRVVRVRAMVGNAGELGGPAELRIESLTTEGTFTTKKGNDYRVQHAVRIEIPNEPRWAGKTVRVFIQLLLENPDKQAVIRESSVGEPVAIPVAPEGAGPMYRSSWRVALFGGALPAVLVGFVLARLAGPPQPKRSAPAAVAPSATKPTA